MMTYLIQILIVLSFLSFGCQPLSNQVQPTVLECGEDFAAGGRPWIRAETSTGVLLSRNEFQVLALNKGMWETLEISSRGCFHIPFQSEWIVRSPAWKESRLLNEKRSFSSGQRLRLEANGGDSVKFICPLKPINSEHLKFDQILEFASPDATRLVVNFELLAHDTQVALTESRMLPLGQDLSLLSSTMPDGTYLAKFKVHDLRLDQTRDHECKIQLDNTPPAVELDRSHLISDKIDDKEYFVIRRQEQLRFKTNNPFPDQASAEYCFRPLKQDRTIMSGACELSALKTVAMGEPISPSLNIGTWELHFRGVDSAGNQAEWQRISPVVYADSATMQQILLESRSDMIQTEISKVNGIFDVLFKAFNNYAVWKSLNTEFEKNKTRQAITSLFYAAHIGMNNYSQFISATDRTNNMIISPDGERLFVGVYNGDTEIYDLRSKKLLSTLKGHWASAASLSLSQDKKTLVTGNFDQSIKVWDLENSQLVSTIACCEGSFLRVAISPNMKNIVSSSWNRIVKIWSLDGTLEKSISLESEPNFHSDVIMSVKISPDGKYFVTGSWDRTVKLWDLTTGVFIRKMETDHSDGVNDVEFSQDSQLLFSAAKDGQILVHNIADGTLSRRLATLPGSVTSIAVGQRRLIAGSLDNAIRIWDLQTSQLVEGPINVGYFGMDDVAISDAGNVYAATGNTPVVRIWGSNGKSDFVQSWAGHTPNSSIRSLALDAEHNRLFSGGTDGKILAWDWNLGSSSLVDQADTIYDLKVSPQRDYLYASSKDGSLRRYPLSSLAVEPPFYTRAGTWLYSLEFDPLSSQPYLGTWDGLILSPGSAGGSNEASVSVGWVKLLFEPFSKKLLVLSRDKYLGLFDPASALMTQKISYDEALISGRVSHDGRSAFVGVWDGKVSEVDLESFSEKYRFNAEGGIVWDLLEDREAGYLVTSTNDGKVRIWNAADQQIVGVPLKVSSKAPRAMLYSEQDMKLITGDDDGLVKIWNLPLTRDVETMRILVCAHAGDVLRSTWFIAKYKMDLSELCVPQ